MDARREWCLGFLPLGNTPGLDPEPVTPGFLNATPVSISLICALCLFVCVLKILNFLQADCEDLVPGPYHQLPVSKHCPRPLQVRDPLMSQHIPRACRDSIQPGASPKPVYLPLALTWPVPQSSRGSGSQQPCLRLRLGFP